MNKYQEQQMPTTTISNGETKLKDGTYRLTNSSGDSSPVTIINGKVHFLLKGTLLEGKLQYKKL